MLDKGATKEVDNVSKLEAQLCEYFSIIKKGDRSPYMVLLLLAAISAINRFYNSSISKVKPVNLCNQQVFLNL
ncbi:14701_t:CDS:1, partial [Dentiscutata heterogama]